jgi:hypothetical protein
VIEPVVLGWVCPGTVSSRFMDSVLRFVFASAGEVQLGNRQDHVIAGYKFIESGPRIAAARNSLVRQFLNDPTYEKVEWFLMLDADMVFDESLLPALFQDVRDAEGNVQRPIVGGLCFGGGREKVFPTMYKIVDPKTNDGEAVRVIDDWTEGAAVQVDATGAACLLVHRSVYEAMLERLGEPVPWFAESIYKGVEFGEDWTFMLRAGSMGYPIIVNTNAKVGHQKPIVLDENLWRDGRVALETKTKREATITPINRARRRLNARSR